MAVQWQDVEVYHGTLFNVWERTTTQPRGGTSRFEVVTHPDAVAIVALRRRDSAEAEPEVALVRQSRPAIGAETIEIPAGLIRDDEHDEPMRAAQRELREETGAGGGRWRELTREYPSPGYSTELITIYLAEDVEVPAGAAPQDPTEISQVEWVGLSQALALCQNGTIQDGKTLLGLVLASGARAASQGAGGGESMPMDPTNAPFARSVRYRDPVDPVDVIDSAGGEGARGGAAGERVLDTSLKLEDMLLEEFNYASVTAYQALEDRARLFNNYLVIAAGGGVGVVGAIYQLNQAGAKGLEAPAAAMIFLLLGILGAAFFASLLRVRQAYGGSLLAMTAIKEFYLAQFERAMPLAKHAFLWRLDTLPRNERLGSVTFVKTFTVGLLDSLAFGGFAGLVAYAGLSGAVGPDLLGWASLGVGTAVTLISALLHVLFYQRTTSNAKAIERERQNLAELRSGLAANQ